MSRSDGGGNWCVRAHEPASSSVRLEEVRLTLVTIPLGKTRISLSLSFLARVYTRSARTVLVFRLVTLITMFVCLFLIAMEHGRDA